MAVIPPAIAEWSKSLTDSKQARLQVRHILGSIDLFQLIIWKQFVNVGVYFILNSLTNGILCYFITAIVQLKRSPALFHYFFKY